MTAAVGAATSGPRPELISATYRRFQRMGFADPEAANLTALKSGFGITSQPWSVWELAHLLFLRELRFVGRRWSDADDRFDADDGTPVVAMGNQAPTSAVGNRASPPVPRSGRRDDADPRDGAVTLLTLLRSMAGPNATLDLLRGSASPRLDATGDADREDR